MEKKRLLHGSIFILTALCLFLCFPEFAQARMISVAGKKVNLRSGPGTRYAVLWEYGQGFPLKVLETKGNWYKVVDFENDVGWIYKKLTIRSPHMVVKAEKVNIHSGPGVEHKVVGKAEKGVVFKTLKQQPGWAHIRHETGLEGWVRRDLVWGW